MASVLNPYLNFNGNARQAMEFYRDVFGGDLMITTFAELGAADGADADKVMHAGLETTKGYTLYGSDVPSHMQPYQPPAAFAVSISGDDPILRDYFEKLSAGGGGARAQGKAAGGVGSGMLTDPFGIPW